MMVACCAERPPLDRPNVKDAEQISRQRTEVTPVALIFPFGAAGLACGEDSRGRSPCAGSRTEFIAEFVGLPVWPAASSGGAGTNERPAVLLPTAWPRASGRWGLEQLRKDISPGYSDEHVTDRPAEGRHRHRWARRGHGRGARPQPAASLEGSPGTGKTTIALQFLMAGAEAGEGGT